MAHAVAEYSFLQDRLSLWLAYDYKPPTAQGNLLSAALALYQGAVNGGIVGPDHLPQSMLYVAGTASLFGGGPPGKPSIEGQLAAPGKGPKEPITEETAATSVKAPEEVEGVGATVSNSETEIVWGKGIKDQNGKWEQYYGKVNPDATYLGPYAKGFDHFNDATGEAISNKTLNTLTAGYIKNPQEIFRQLKRYVDNAVNYEPRLENELAPTLIESKTIQLAIPEYTSPMQWRYLLRAIIYGKDNGVSIVITRIRE